MTRITINHLRYKVERINAINGYDDVTYSTIGAIRIGRAYGGARIERVCNRYGGINALTGYGTMREADNFLAGMLAALNNN